MESQLLQAVGKIAGIGGLALGVFLLLFREVIRKSIFPTLSDDYAYRLIRLFMTLTFAIAASGIAAWTYVSTRAATVRSGLAAQVSPSGPIAPARSVEQSATATVDITGMWKASVKYSWGPTYPETFEFEMHGQELSGSASYLTAAHGLIDGRIEGNQLSFQTTSYTEVGDQRYQEKHRYRGTVRGDEIRFVLDTDSGYDAAPPDKFTARRVATK